MNRCLKVLWHQDDQMDSHLGIPVCHPLILPREHANPNEWLNRGRSDSCGEAHLLVKPSPQFVCPVLGDCRRLSHPSSVLSAGRKNMFIYFLLHVRSQFVTWDLTHRKGNPRTFGRRMFLSVPLLPCEKVRPGHHSTNVHSSSTVCFTQPLLQGYLGS